MLELITCTDVRLNKLLRHKKTDDVKLHTKQRHLYEDTLQYAILMQTRKHHGNVSVRNAPQICT